jgi:hypothetical protein
VRTGGDYRLSKGKPQPEHAQYVFGIGTGRCGTVSLGKLLKGQPWSLVSHENRGDASNAGGYAPFWSPESPATLQQIAAARLQFMRVRTPTTTHGVGCCSYHHPWCGLLFLPPPMVWVVVPTTTHGVGCCSYSYR